MIQDNASSDGTAGLVAAISDPRVKYFCAAERLSMRGNFEAAVGHARGDYIIMIGDDDGMVPGSLTRLDHLLSGSDLDFISWPTLYYYWPSADPSGAQFGLTLKRNGIYGANEHVRGRVLAAALARAEPVHFRRLPKLYHGCVSRRLIDQIAAATGSVFKYDIPDLYVQAAAVMVDAKGLSLLHPASINGGSANSTGGGQFGNTSGELNKSTDNSFGRFMQEAALDSAATVPFNPHFASTDYYTYASLVIAAASFKPDLQIAHDAWVKRVVRQLSQNPSLLRIAKRAPVLSALDRRVVAALKDVPEPALAAVSADAHQPLPAPQKKLQPSKALSRCRLSTEVDGVDTVLTATEVLGSAFAERHSDFAPFLGWQALQFANWCKLLAANRDRMVG